jgi:Ca2+-binding RTX toxin-like protein
MATLIVGVGGFATIQAAVNASASGDSIQILAGTYQEQVIVSGKSNLNISAAIGAAVTVLAPTDVTQTATSSGGRAINAVFTVLDSDNVTLSGFDVNGNGSGATVDGPNANFVGIAYRNASGSAVGMDVTAVRWAYEPGTTPGGNPVVNGVQSGVGIYVDNGDFARKDFTMTGGTISDFQKSGAVFFNANLNVTGVSITGNGAQPIIAQNGIEANQTTGSIANNVVSAIGYSGDTPYYSSGIIVYGNDNLGITNNIIVGANTESLAAKLYGIYVDGYNYVAPFASNNVSVTGNTISHADIAIAGYAGNIFGGDYGSFTGIGTITGNNITNLDVTDQYAAGIEFIAPDQLAPFTINGTSFRDYFEGGAGDDTLNGLGGNDMFISSLGNDRMDGGAGIDTVDYSNASGNLTVNLASINAQNTGAAGVDTLRNIENLIGGAFDDRLTGSAAANDIRGGDGKDVINGGAGNDDLYGEAGNDTINGGTGQNNLYGGDGDDRLTGGADTDMLDGGADNDLLSGGGGNDLLLGGDGNDTLLGGLGDDVLIGGGGKDLLTGNAGIDTFRFLLASDSGMTTATRDEIRDFTVGTDKIDFSALGVDYGDVNILSISGVKNRVIVQLDVDGDSAYDLQVQVTFTGPAPYAALSATDFIF